VKLLPPFRDRTWFLAWLVRYLNMFTYRIQTWLLQYSGGLPYVAASGTTVYLAHQAGLASAGIITSIDPGVAHTLLDQALNIQVTYGAVMLSFLGALHWGMEFAGYGGQKGYARLALGAAPILFAWPTLSLEPMSALIAQWVGFTGLWYADNKVTALGWSKSRTHVSPVRELLILGVFSSEVVFAISILLVYSCGHMYHRLSRRYILLGSRCWPWSPFARSRDDPRCTQAFES
jgi:hypothetical protein